MGGGPGIITHELPKFFSKEHDVLFICPGAKTKLVRVNRRLQIAYISSEKQQELSVPNLGVSNIFYIFKALGNFRPEVIHSQDVDPISLLSQIWAVLHNVTFFHTIHVFPGQIGDFGMSEISKSFARFYTSGLFINYITNYLNNSDALITLNAHVEKNVRDFGYQGKTYVIPNGLDFGRFKPCRPTNLKLKKKELLFVGFLSRRKNQIFLIEMMKFLPDNYHLTLIGDPINANYKYELLNFIRDNKLEQKIKIKDKLPHQEVVKYLARTHVFVSASVMELQSLVILEALASQTPVVGLDNETIDEMIDDRVGHKLEKSSSPEQFAKSVDALCRLSEQDYLNLCRNARAKVLSQDWQNVSKKFIEAYQEAIAHKQYRDQSQRLRMVDRIIPIFQDLLIVRFLKDYMSRFSSYLSLDKEKKHDDFAIKHRLRKRKLLKPNRQFFYVIFAVILSVSGFFTLRLIKNTKKIKDNLMRR